MINLYINERQVNGVTVLDLKGRVRVGGPAIALHKTFLTLVHEGKILIVLNLEGVTHIGSSGLGELVSGQVSVYNKGGEIKLLQLTETLHELLAATRLLAVFDVYDDEAEVVRSFSTHVSRIKQAAPSFV